MDIIEDLLRDAFARSRRAGRPVVTLSYAQSLDGCLSTAQDERLGLSGAETKQLTHQLRAAHDAILVGIGTVLTDDPSLSARLAGGPHPQPVVLDGWLRLPLESALMQRADCRPWVVCRQDAPDAPERALAGAGARVFRVSAGEDGMVDVAVTLALLGQAGVTALMVEGGARVITSFLARRLADQAAITVAPFWVGGYNAISGRLAGPDVRPALLDPCYRQYGRDLVVWGRIGEEPHAAQGAVFHRA